MPNQTPARVPTPRTPPPLREPPVTEMPVPEPTAPANRPAPKVTPKARVVTPPHPTGDQPGAPLGQATGQKETVDQFIARGGKITKVPGQPTPEPKVTAAPKKQPVNRAILGEGPEVEAVKPTSQKRAGIRPGAPERGQVRPPLPRGDKVARAQVNTFKEPFARPEALQEQKEIVDLAKTDPQKAGRQYEDLVARDIKGGEDIQNKFRRQGRRMDVGTEHEMTIEGMEGELSGNKLDQLWDDLVDKGNAVLTVPKSSPQARDQLARMLALARTKIGPNVIIVVRETLP